MTKPNLDCCLSCQTCLKVCIDGEDVICAKCRAEEEHDWDTDPHAEYDRSGRLVSDVWRQFYFCDLAEFAHKHGVNKEELATALLCASNELRPMWKDKPLDKVTIQQLAHLFRSVLEIKNGK